MITARRLGLLFGLLPTQGSAHAAREGDIVALGRMICAEARGLGRAEQLAIAQVAKTLAAEGRRSIRVEVANRRWAGGGGCPASERARFVRLARAFLEGRAKAPKWARKARAFVAPRALRKVSGSWRRRGFVPIKGTRTAHIFWRRR